MISYRLITLNTQQSPLMERYLVCLSVIFTVIVYHRTSASIIPAEKIREIVQYEENLISALGNYIQEENERDNDIEEAIRSFHLSAQEENLSFNLNPVDIFRLNRRVVDGWDQVLEKVLCENCVKNNGTDDVERALYKCQRRTMWPRENDVTDSAVALVRLCRIYQLNLDDVTNGRLADTDTVTLNLDDILFIADAAIENGFLYETVQWLKSGITKAKKSGAEDATVIKFYRELAGAYYQAQMPSQSVKFLQECSSLYPSSKSLKRELQYYTQRAKDSSTKGDDSELTPRVMGKALTACERLCRGEGKPQSSRPLYCRLRPTRFLFDLPVREEMLSWKPRVVRVHQALNQQQTDYFANITSDTVERSGRLAWARETTASKSKKDGYELDDVRSSLLENVVEITGLKSRRYVQVMNLGLGENLRVKKLINTLDTYHEKLYSTKFYQFPAARWTYFLSDTVGSDIVFPDLSLTVPSIKGDALYWYNLKPNGDPETRTRYCACPTLLGSPWVSSMDLFVPNEVETMFCGKNRKSAYHS